MELLWGDAMKLPETMFGITPEALDAVDMCRAAHELAALPMVDSEVLRVAHVNQTVIATPPIRIDDRFRSDAATNNGLKSGLFAVRHNLCVDLAVTLQETEDDGLTRGPAPPLAANPSGTEVRLIDFDFAGRER